MISDFISDADGRMVHEDGGDFTETEFNQLMDKADNLSENEEYLPAAQIYSGLCANVQAEICMALAALPHDDGT